MNRGIEKDVGDLLGKGMEAKVISMLWVKMWNIKRHLGKWESRLCGGMWVTYRATYRVGQEVIDVGEFGKASGLDRQFRKGLGIWLGWIPRGDRDKEC